LIIQCGLRNKKRDKLYKLGPILGFSSGDGNIDAGFSLVELKD
jgi:hypothetical protein